MDKALRSYYYFILKGFALITKESKKVIIFTTRLQRARIKRLHKNTQVTENIGMCTYITEKIPIIFMAVKGVIKYRLEVISSIT